MNDRWIVFDLIGVLAEPSWRDIGSATLEQWNAFKVGQQLEREFWSNNEESVYRRHLAFRPDRLALVRRLKSQGYRLCVATNFSKAWLDALLEKIEQPDLFDAKVISSEIRAAKPDDAFWEAVLRLAPRGSVFVDDRKENCDAAHRAGLRTIWAHPACALDQELEALLRTSTRSKHATG